MSRLAIIVLILSIFFFVTSGFLLKGSLNNMITLGKEIHSPPDALYNYNITKKTPFKYRLLFPSIVKSTYATLKKSEDNQLFYNVYIFWSAVFYVGAAISFFFLLKAVNFEASYAFWGTLLFLGSPAIISAYALPVHTREDMLGYMIMNITLIFIVRNQVWGILLFVLLGVLCRETLLLIPIVYVFYGKAEAYKRVFVLVACLLLFLSLRFGMGESYYNVLGLGLKYNLQNIPETIGFLFLVFSFMWPPFLYDLFYTHILKRETKYMSEPLNFLRRSSLLAFVLVLITTFIGGRINEIRLLFILFPWVISVFLFCVQDNSLSILGIVKSTKFRRYFLFCCCIFLLIGAGLYYYSESIPGVENSPIPYSQWMALILTYCFICFICIPFYTILINSRTTSLISR